MHKIAAIVIALAMAGAATAQEEEETLFGSFEDPSFGGFGGPALKVTTLNGELGLLTGGRGGLIVDNTWLIGGGGYGRGGLSRPRDGRGSRSGIFLRRLRAGIRRPLERARPR
jgi:hypothetical protein